MLGKFLDPKNDYAFKRIFGTERNQDILIHFINDMLGFAGERQIQSVSLLPTAQDPEIAAKKQSILDVLCVDQLGRQYIVEMQVSRMRGFEKRAQYYAAKAYSRQLNQGEEYHKLKEIIFLAIADFVMFPDKTTYKSDHVILDKESYEHDLRDFYFTFVELPKFTKSIDELDSIVEKWTYFFKHAEETNEQELEKIVGADKVIQRAYEELNRFSWTEAELNTYEQEEKRERDAQAIAAQKELDLEQKRLEVEQNRLEVEQNRLEVEQNRLEVEQNKLEVEQNKLEVEQNRLEVEMAKANYRQEGIEQGIEQVARSLRQAGSSTEEIAKHTGLSKDRIEDL